jgi:hypothetical protein
MTGCRVERRSSRRRARPPQDRVFAMPAPVAALSRSATWRFPTQPDLRVSPKRPFKSQARKLTGESRKTIVISVSGSYTAGVQEAPTEAKQR